MGKTRLVHIDLLKSIAMYFVVIYHSTLYSFDFLSEGTRIHYFIYYFRTILSTCVPLFFFTNGYLLFGRDFHLRKHICKTCRLVLLTFIWGAIALLALQVIHHNFLSLHEFLNYLWNWEYGWINHLWYLGALVCIYIFFPLLKQTFDTNFPIFCYFTAAAALFTLGNTFLNHVGTVSSRLLSENATAFMDINHFNIFNPFRGIRGYTFVYFCAGGIAYSLKDKIKAIPVRKRNILSTVGILFSCLGLWVTGIIYSKVLGQLWDVVWNGYDSIFTFFNVIFIHLLCLNWHTDHRAIRIVSSNTLGIYFLNGIVVAIFRPYWLMFDFLKNLPANLLFACFVIAVCVSICSIIKKIPVCSKLL